MSGFQELLCQPIGNINNPDSLILICIVMCSCYQYFWIRVFYFQQRVNLAFKGFAVAVIQTPSEE